MRAKNESFGGRRRKADSRKEKKIGWLKGMREWVGYPIVIEA